MRKLQLFLVFIIIALPAFSQESRWVRLYDRINTLEYKNSIVQSAADSEDRDTIPMFQRALDETNEMVIATLDRNQKRHFDEIQRTSVQKLGEFKVVESEDAVYKVYENTDVLVIKTDSIIALGQMGSAKYIEEFITTLRNINMRTDSNVNTRDNEAIASALITYFADIKDERSYEAVFYASVGWYSPRSGVKELAKETLKVVSDDPSDILKNIIERDPDFHNKFIALSAENESSASDEKKSILAVVGLNEGIRHKTSTATDNMHLLNIRLLACNMLRDSSHKAPEALPALERILFDNYDSSEKLTVIETLNTYKSDESVAILIKYLQDQNNKQAQGMSAYTDRRAVTATIIALGESENPAARDELIVTTTISTWPSAVIREAQAALRMK